MGLIYVPQRRLVKPASVLDVDRDLAAKSGTIWLSVANTGLLLHDLIGGRNIASPGTLAPSTEGPAIAYNGSQQTNLSFTLPGGTTPDAYIVAARIRATAAQGGNPGNAFGIFSATGDQGGIGVGFDTSNNVGATFLTGNGAGLQAYSAGSQQRWYTVYARSYVTGGSHTFAAWIDGEPAATGQNGLQGGGMQPLNEIVVGAQHRLSGFLRQFTGQIAWASILYLPTGNSAFTDDSARQLFRSGYPYNLFSRRIWVPVSAGGGTVFTITPSGGVSFSGSAVAINDKTFSPGGSIAFSGLASLAYTKIQEVSGGVTYSGTAPITLTSGATEYIITPTGGITLNGSSTQIKTKAYVPSGTINFNGTNAVVYNNVYAVGGGVTLSGSAPLSFVPFGSVTVTTRLPLTGVGQ